MCGVTEMLLAVFLLTDLMLAAASRLLHCIRVVVAQGILLGILPLVMSATEDRRRTGCQQSHSASETAAAARYLPSLRGSHSRSQAASRCPVLPTPMPSDRHLLRICDRCPCSTVYIGCNQYLPNICSSRERDIPVHQHLTAVNHHRRSSILYTNCQFVSSE